MNKDNLRIIEVAFPLKQTSLDSVKEKYGPRGHISGFHIWPARRPLAACRAILITALLPDPGNDIERNSILTKLAGTTRQDVPSRKKGETQLLVFKEHTDGGILRWGRESDPDLYYFQEEIKRTYNGRAPRVLDPFAGGGAIPFEAMRLGCDVTANDINPVAWFILKCTLEYPQRFAGKTRPLPSFALHSPEFMVGFVKGMGHGVKPSRRKVEETQGMMLEAPQADLSWHVRAWGYWVLEQARKDLEKFYPTINGKPTAAYLWARTVTCKNCRTTIPLLKTLWLCRKENKRIRLKLKPRTERTGVDFEIVTEPIVGGNAAQRRAHDQEVGKGTMTRSGAWCPICGNNETVAMTMEDIKADMVTQNKSGFAKLQMTAVVIDGVKGKEYRLPTIEEINATYNAKSGLETLFKGIPFGLPTEPTPTNPQYSGVYLYGMDQWFKIFTPRQLMALGIFVTNIRKVSEAMREEAYRPEWIEAVNFYLATALDRLIDHSTSLATWYLPGENVKHTFVRFALPITWDFAESNPIFSGGGSWSSAINLSTAALEHALMATSYSSFPSVVRKSAIQPIKNQYYDLILTDPPYYGAIPYSNTMDCFYVWLRRTLFGVTPELDSVFQNSLGPKWDETNCDGELIDDASRFKGDKEKSKANYENGMFRAFRSCYGSLTDEGRFIVVFANKQPDAWETLVSSVVHAGFQVCASWPIQTENTTRMRAQSSSALASSVWIVCRKREETTRPGWDNRVLDEMRENIEKHLPKFWDAGIRGPDFIWAATGPAMEAYSKYPVVKKADQPDSLMTVSEFLGHVRRMVVDYVVGRILSTNGETAESLDDLTIYYLLHRQSFGMEETPIGAVILYAQSCNLRDRDLIDRFDILAHGRSKTEVEEAEEKETEVEEDTREETGTSGSTAKLKSWVNRKRKDLGLDSPGREAPLIDRVHRIMQLWRTGEVQKVDNYLEETGLRRSAIFPKLLQSLIELARKEVQADEVALLESIMNHTTGRGMHPQIRLMLNEDNS